MQSIAGKQLVSQWLIIGLFLAHLGGCGSEDEPSGMGASAGNGNGPAVAPIDTPAPGGRPGLAVPEPSQSSAPPAPLAGGEPPGTVGPVPPPIPMGIPPENGGVPNVIPSLPPDREGARVGLAARIGKAEYANSVSVVLGVAPTDGELDAANGGIPDDSGDGVFKHFADKQNSVEQHAASYFTVAEAIGQRIDTAQLAETLGFCQEATAACGREVTSVVGRRLFRRALDERELTTFSAVFEESLSTGLDFPQALGWTVSALLQAPQFLFRMDAETEGQPGMDRPLTDLELASRLASFIWVSVPDDELLSVAEAGQLRPQLQAQVARMVQDEQAKQFAELFAKDFSRAHRASFEGATDEIKEALSDSLVATFQHHLWDKGGSVADLFTTTEFVVNPVVAEILGIDAPAAPQAVVDVSELPERMGLLTHPGSIAGMGDRGIGSFVNRGKYLMERLLCRHPAAAPDTLQDQMEAFEEETTGLNEHERVARRKTRPECWFCHSQFDPFAFGFSRFDGSGRYLGEQDEAGKPLAIEGWVPVTTEANSPTYSNISEYMAILSTDETIQTCMTEHFLSFATARSPDPVGKTHAKTVSDAYLEGGSSLEAMVQAVVNSHLFQQIEVQAPDAVGGQN